MAMDTNESTATTNSATAVGMTLKYGQSKVSKNKGWAELLHGCVALHFFRQKQSSPNKLLHRGEF